MSQISPAQLLASLSEEERELELSKLTPKQKAALKWHWPFWARPDQLPPEGDWTTWLLLAGRGFGKSRVGSEWVRQMALENPGCRIALVGETAADTRKVMVEGDSGILNISPPDFMPEYSPANRTLRWPNGSMAETYNATQPDQLRGPQHHFAWCDEIAKWQYMQDSWDQLQFGLRLGKHPKQVVTTTPRPLPLIKKLVSDPDTVVTRGRTMDNASNLASPFLKQIEERYGGTRLGRQELDGEILDDIPGALWSRAMIDESRVYEAPADMDRVIVAVDPAASSEEGSDENGIVVVGMCRDKDGYARGYVLEDATLRGSPEEWARRAVNMYRKWQADKIVAEKNQGGEMVEAVIRAVDRSVPLKLVHASRGKIIRAEPISALYEQRRIHHVGRLDLLEDQMCTFSVDNIRGNGMGSPDRVDALVWGLSELFEKITGRRRVDKSATTGNTTIAETLHTQRWETPQRSNPNMWMAG
jgi:phage terminase large subunit-like protein